MKRYVLLVMVLLWAGLMTMAQNSIDEFVDNLENQGISSVTSIVKRNPKTRQVVKTVKTVKIIGKSVSRVWDLFDKESKNGTSIELREGGRYSRILVMNADTTARVYQIEADRPKSPVCKITIIAKRKERH